MLILFCFYITCNTFSPYLHCPDDKGSSWSSIHSLLLIWSQVYLEIFCCTLTLWLLLTLTISVGVVLYIPHKSRFYSISSSPLVTFGDIFSAWINNFFSIYESKYSSQFGRSAQANTGHSFIIFHRNLRWTAVCVPPHSEHLWRPLQWWCALKMSNVGITKKNCNVFIQMAIKGIRICGPHATCLRWLHCGFLGGFISINSVSIKKHQKQLKLSCGTGFCKKKEPTPCLGNGRRGLVVFYDSIFISEKTELHPSHDIYSKQDWLVWTKLVIRNTCIPAPSPSNHLRLLLFAFANDAKSRLVIIIIIIHQ